MVKNPSKQQTNSSSKTSDDINTAKQRPEDVETVKKPKLTPQLKGCTVCDYITSIPRRTVCPAHPKVKLMPKKR